MSTEYNDAGITNERCCQAAVDDTLIGEDMYDMWCFASTEPADDADLKFDDNTDTCTMVSGTTKTLYRGADQDVKFTSTSESMADVVVFNNFCCLAYDDTSTDSMNIEL